MNEITQFDQFGSIYLALIAMTTAIVSPMLMAWLTNRYRKQEKMEEYARQDVVAARVAAAAARTEVMAIKVDVAATKMAETNDRLVAKTTEIGGQIAIVHTLVNSSLSAALQAQLNALMLLLASTNDPALLTDEIKDQTRNRIKDLQAVIADREKQSSLADKQIVTQAEEATAKAANEPPKQQLDDARVAAAMRAVADADAKVAEVKEKLGLVTKKENGQ
jgi:hypothetical protein